MILSGGLGWRDALLREDGLRVIELSLSFTFISEETRQACAMADEGISRIEMDAIFEAWIA